MAQSYSTLFPTASASGTGQGGINYAFDAGVNIDGESADVSTWTGTMTIAQTLVAGEVLRGSGSLLLSSGAAAQTKDITFAIPEADENKLLGISFDMKSLGAYAAGDITVQIVEAAGSVIDIPAGQGLFQHSFVSGNAGTYTLRFTNASGAAILAANGLVIDNIVVGPDKIVTGAAVTEWESYTPTFSANFGTVTGTNFKWRRVGDTIEIEGTATSGTTTTGAGTISFPDGLTPVGGYGVCIRDTTTPYFFVARGSGSSMVIDDNNSSTPNLNAVIGTGEFFTINYKAEIAEWAGSGTVNIYTEDNLSKWTAYTPIFFNDITKESSNWRWRRVGQDMEIIGNVRVDAGGAAGTFRASLPSGYTADTSIVDANTLIAIASPASIIGYGSMYDASVGANKWFGAYLFDTSSVGFVGEGFNIFTANEFAVDDVFSIVIKVPIAEWTNSNQNSLVGFGMATSTQAGLVKSDVDYITSADATTTGLVSTGTQTFAGVKTFTDAVKVDTVYSDKKTLSSVPNSTPTALWVLAEGNYLITVKSITNTLAHGTFLVYINGGGTATITSLVSSSCSLTSPSAYNVSVTHTLGATYDIKSSIIHLNF